MIIYIIKKAVIFILIIIIIGAIVLNIKNKKDKTIIIDTVNTEIGQENKTYNLCYYRGTKTSTDLRDVAWLKLNIMGEKISGEFHNLPAEKDSKIGTFKGTVGPVINMSRQANVWWDSLAEGMNVLEELSINFGEGNATVGFGEMVDRGDGTYVYKDKSDLYFIDAMGQIDCENLDEKLFAERYIRDNISKIATNKAVLGGNWYVTSVNILPDTDTGEVIYEDGHIASKANIVYTYQKSPQNIVVTKFEIKK